MEMNCQDCAGILASDRQILKNQRRIKWVVAFSLVMMIGEVAVGIIAGSMSLVAEGWHMGAHVGALLITLLAYWLAKHPAIEKKLSFGAGKFIPLGGYTSAIVLGIVALLVFAESVERLISPIAISFNEALWVAALGLVVNIISALLLNSGGHEHAHHGHHHGHDHNHGHSCGHDHKHVHDHNLRSAFLHIIADAVTSVLAILALMLGKLFNWGFLDPIVGIIGAMVIFSWAFTLCRDTGWELLDGHSKTIDWPKLRKLVEVDGTQIIDFHIWRIAPTAVACELIVKSQHLRGSDYYRQILANNFSARHVIVEERPA